MMTKEVVTGVRPLYEIAEEIRKDWRTKREDGWIPKVYFGAVPYLDAMSTLDTMTDMYGCDPARSIVAYFLANATTWRGETAKRVKKELNGMLKSR